MQKQNSAPHKSFFPTGLQHSATSNQAVPAQSSAPVIVHPPPVIHSSKILGNTTLIHRNTTLIHRNTTLIQSRQVFRDKFQDLIERIFKINGQMSAFLYNCQYSVGRLLNFEKNCSHSPLHPSLVGFTGKEIWNSSSPRLNYNSQQCWLCARFHTSVIAKTLENIFLYKYY
ncbi:hypothetical protein CEXT_741621 [Caerostris extrusa]|uniref:Uncharacterized protein n=1 Tax=Caerostris extrusa TaxID=172846 RepID=A0AAV4Q5V1_CAEEX|nr:hypothetical protein CEXT_741621 [Caerostris extrusa]